MGNGTGGMSIYGAKFPDENLKFRMEKKGLLAMANSGPNTNNSQFFITIEPTPWLDGLHVVLGEIVQGLEVLELLHMGGSASGEPTSEFKIVDCGVI